MYWCAALLLRSVNTFVEFFMAERNQIKEMVSDIIVAKKRSFRSLNPIFLHVRHFFNISAVLFS